jgi:hypothetical protein
MIDMNNLISAGLSIVVGALIFGAWRVLCWVYNAAMYKWTMTLQISEDTPLQWTWLQSYIQSNLARDTRHWIVTSSSNLPQPGDIPLPMRIVFEGKSIRLKISQVAPSQMTIQQSYDAKNERRVATMWTRNVDAKFFARFVKMLKIAHETQSSEEIRIALPSINYQGATWQHHRQMVRRSWSTLTLDPNVLETAMRDLEFFLTHEHRSFCKEHGIPYRRGWLLEGAPGNGKSSFITVAASHIGAPVCILSLNSKDMDDTQLKRLMIGSLPDDPPRFIVLEDVDCLFANRADQGESDGHVTLSGLLNALDGVGSAENAIIVMTSNYPERLDAALIRPGRVDRRLFFDNPNDSLVAEHFIKFFPDATRLSETALDFVARCRRVAQVKKVACSMSLVQEEIIREVNQKLFK